MVDLYCFYWIKWSFVYSGPYPTQDKSTYVVGVSDAIRIYGIPLQRGVRLP